MFYLDQQNERQGQMHGHNKLFERKTALQMIRRKSQICTQESGEDV